MKARSSLILVAIAALLPATTVEAQDPGLEGRFSIAFQGGIVTEVSGNVLVHTEGTLFAKPATVFANSYRSTFETGFSDYNLALTFNLGVTPGTEIFVRASHFEKTPLAFLAGTVTYREEDGSLVDSDLNAILTPYEEWGAELGYRWYLAWRTRMKSFVAVVGGVRFTDQFLIEAMSAPDRNSYILNVPLYVASTVPVFGADVGFTIDLGDHFFLGLEAEIRYQTKLSASEYSFPGLPGLNSGGSRWSAPVFLTAGIRF